MENKEKKVADIARVMGAKSHLAAIRRIQLMLALELRDAGVNGDLANEAMKMLDRAIAEREDVVDEKYNEIMY